MENEEQKNVEENVLDTGSEKQVESPTTDEQTDVAKELEEAKARAAQLEETNKKLVENLRKKESKRTLLGVEEKIETPKELEERLERLEKSVIEKSQRIQSASINEFLASDIGKRYANNGNEDNDANYKELSKAFDFLTKRDGVPETKEDYKKLLKEADAIARRDYNSLLSKQQNNEQNAMQKRMAATGSSTYRQSETTIGLTQRQIEIAKKCGLNPKDVYKTK